VIPHDAGLPDPSSHVPSPQPREGYPIAGRIDGPQLPPRVPGPPPTAPGLSASPDVFSLLVALRRRWISAVLLGGTLGTIAAVTAWFLLMPKHIAFTRLQIAAIQLPILANPTPTANDFKTYMQTASAAIMSRPVIMAALKREPVQRLGLSQEEMDPLLIEDDLKTEFKEYSEYLTLMYSHPDPKVAVTLTEAIKNSYLENVVDAERDRRAKRVTELEKVYNEKLDALKNKKESLKKLAEDLGVKDPAVWQAQRIEIANALRDAKQRQVQYGFELIKARSLREAFEERMKSQKDASGAIKPRDEKQLLADALEEALEQDREAADIRLRIRSAEAEIESLQGKGYSDDYISVKTARQRIDLYQKQVEKRRDALAKVVKVRRPQIMQSTEDPAFTQAQLQKQEKSLADLNATLQSDIKTLSEQAARNAVWPIQYEQMAADIREEEKIVGHIRTNLEQERVELQSASRIVGHTPADLMKKEIKKQLLATAVAPIAVIFGVCMALAMLEYRKRRVRSASEISRGLGIRVVGAVPRVRNLHRLLTSESEMDFAGTPVMESIDAIRTRLLHDAKTRSTRLVMVTSATGGEGKTTLAGHLASSLARAGRRTLLLDGDLRAPRLHEVYEVPLQPGFSEILLGEVDLADAARETHQENLSVISAGQWDREVLFALARDGLEGVFEKLADEFDFVIIDSHPVLAATDSLLIGRQVDAVILSVLGEVSQMPRVYAAQQQLAGLGVRVLGAVVNGTDPEEVFTAPPATANVA
jgi:capsular exopolysaccharide synthesis family protein